METSATLLPDATIAVVRRLRLAVIVALLTLSASGVLSLVVMEPCSATEAAGSGHGVCPPSCVACACCAQAVELVVPVPPVSTGDVVIDFVVPLETLPQADPRDILHVPRTLVA